MFGIGSLELIIIVGVALVFLKPKDLINIVKSLKELKTSFNKTIDQGNNYINNIIEETDLDTLKEQSKGILEERTQEFYDELKSVKENVDTKTFTNLEDVIKKKK